METIILTTLFPDGTEIKSNIPTAVFLQGSGVKRLLDLDPTSKIIVEKADGSKISYQYENPQAN